MAYTKRTSPRSVLDGLLELGAPTPRKEVVERGLSTQRYSILQEEEVQPWYGMWSKGADQKEETSKDGQKDGETKASKPQSKPAVTNANSDMWIVGKIKNMNLKSTIHKLTNPEHYAKPKDKYVERVMGWANDNAAATATCKHFDKLLKECSRGSLTNAANAVAILKASYVLHNVMKKGTSEGYKNMIELYPDIFELPQIALPKAIPASCIQARMAVSYATFLNSRVRLHQQAMAPDGHAESQLRSMYGMKKLSVIELFDQGLACRFFRKRDNSSLPDRDVIHAFQMMIISDLLERVDEYENAVYAEFESDQAEELLRRKERQLYNWAERMQCRKFLPEPQYFRLKAIVRFLDKPTIVLH